MEEFKTATFDLGEIGKIDEKGKVETKGCLLMVRPLDMPQAGEIKLTTTFLGKTYEVKVAKPPKESERAAMVLIAIANDTCVAWKVDGTGAVSDHIKGEDVGKESHMELITLSATLVEGGEWWADASMLTLNDAATLAIEDPAMPLGFEFDPRWLFGDDAEDLRSAISHAGLRSMVSAQARLISVSPPIS